MMSLQAVDGPHQGEHFELAEHAAEHHIFEPLAGEPLALRVHSYRVARVGPKPDAPRGLFYRGDRVRRFRSVVERAMELAGGAAAVGPSHCLRGGPLDGRWMPAADEQRSGEVFEIPHERGNLELSWLRYVRGDRVRLDYAGHGRDRVTAYASAAELNAALSESVRRGFRV